MNTELMETNLDTILLLNIKEFYVMSTLESMPSDTLPLIDLCMVDNAPSGELAIYYFNQDNDKFVHWTDLSNTSLLKEFRFLIPDKS